MSLTSQIKEFALDIGYSKVGIIPADSFPEYIDELTNRNEMYAFYINSPNRPLVSAEPRSVMPSAKSIITMVYDYSQKSFPKKFTDVMGRVYQARAYNAPPEHTNGARKQLMREFLSKIGCKVGENIILPERLVAAKAGIVNYGRNNFVYADGIGSFIFLTSFIVDQELEYDQPTVEVGCPDGCSACMKACPTGAIYEPHKINPTRCITFNTNFTQDGMAGSYIQPEMREKMGTKVYGCDICQEVCPRNQARVKGKLPDDEYLLNAEKEFSLAKMLNMTDDFYQRRIYPLMYNYIKDRKYLQRNAAIALGNLGDPEFIPDLTVAMKNQEGLVRGYAAWALGRIGSQQAYQVLQECLTQETSVFVRKELEEALVAIQSISGID
ncbi:epoxyqueuosine reductase [Pelosinus sp. sgz500959]|uniref:epoxyqueuosine reductase n=1 Tax=Pelosinus sp. sgz500959 TaxID=3242472 RepID=UPI00366A9E5E